MEIVTNKKSHHAGRDTHGDRNTEAEQQSLIERNIDFALRKVRHRIGALVVRLEDLNDPKGGLDKRCRIEAYLWRSGMVPAQALDVDFAPAVRRAAGRIAWRVLEQARRRRSRRLAGVR